MQLCDFFISRGNSCNFCWYPIFPSDKAFQVLIKWILVFRFPKSAFTKWVPCPRSILYKMTLEKIKGKIDRAWPQIYQYVQKSHSLQKGWSQPDDPIKTNKAVQKKQFCMPHAETFCREEEIGLSGMIIISQCFEPPQAQKLMIAQWWLVSSFPSLQVYYVSACCPVSRGSCANHSPKFTLLEVHVHMIWSYQSQNYAWYCNCLCSWLPARILSSCSMQAMRGGHHEVFAYEAMWRQDGFNLRAFMRQKGIAKVSLRVGDWRHLGKKKKFTINRNSKHKWTNWISRYLKICNARYCFW